jgi:hypothetical protein
MDGPNDTKNGIFKSFSERNLPSVIYANEAEESELRTESASKLLSEVDKETDLMSHEISSMPCLMDASQNTDFENHSLNHLALSDVSNRSFPSLSPLSSVSAPKTYSPTLSPKQSVDSPEISTAEFFIGANAANIRVANTNIPIT